MAPRPTSTAGRSTSPTPAATTADFQAVYEKATGRDLTAFFDAWLRSPVKPATP